MAERRLRLNQTLSCSICLNLLKEPVTLPCGHSYCMSCINTHWDEEEGKESYSCPQCRHSFTSRPVLLKNTMLAALVEELYRSAVPAEDDPSSAAHGHVLCELCSGTKVKAEKSCLQCLVSYCEEHLQPHYDVAALKKHKLVEPTENLQENMCSVHDEVMKMFCRTDQQCICFLCSVDQHKDHDTVMAVVKRNEMQGELEDSMKKVRQRIEDKQKNMDTLQKQMDDVIRCGNTAVMEADRLFTHIVRLVSRRMAKVELQILSQQASEKHKIKEQQDTLQKDITELKRKYTGLETLSLSENHAGFLLTFPSLSKLSEASDNPVSEKEPPSFLDMVTTAVGELRETLQDTSALDQAVEDETEVDIPEDLEARLDSCVVV